MASKPTSRSLELRQTKGFQRAFIESQFCTKTKPVLLTPATDLSGKAAVVTGSSTGLGLHAARHLLSLNLSRLILAVRSLAKGDGVAAQFRREFPSATIEVWQLEMGSYESIQAFVKRASAEFPGGNHLDIAILNAGVVNNEYTPSPQTGHCEIIQINYISTFLLAILLLPVLRHRGAGGNAKSSPGRLSIVNSGTSLAAKLENRNKRPLLASFDTPKGFNTTERYYDSKLLGQMFFARLLSHLPAGLEDEVIVNMVDPGLCKGTDLHREAGFIVGAVFGAFKAMTARDLKDGAWTYVDAVVAKGKESHGCYVMDWEIRP